MDLASVLTPGDRVIDVGAPDGRLGSELTAIGMRYLGLVPPTAIDLARADAGAIAERLHPLYSASAALQSSTDVLVLRAPYAALCWSLRDLRGVRCLAVEGVRRADEGALAALVLRLGGRARSRGRLAAGGVTMDVLELSGRRSPLRPRQYLSPVWGVTGLARRLEDAGLRYAVLRWFEDLPAMAPGEDLDILVSDADLDRFRKILAEEPGTIPVDLYSESGLPGADFQGAAYYPPRLAAGLLDRALIHGSGARVPAPEDHLNSLAYHAAYHKGYRSGLPDGRERPVQTDIEHDYTAALGKLAVEVGAEITLTLEGVDDYLASVGWRPALDTLRRLSEANAWIRETLCVGTGHRPEPPETTVFLVRERASTEIGIGEVLDVLDHYGFDIVATASLDADAVGRCEAHSRGGNWGKGPFPVSGGGPAVAVVALHHAPQAVDPSLQRRYPRLTNAETYFVKRTLRDLVRQRVGPSGEFNPVHSSDDEDEAWEYVALALPDQVASLRSEVAARRERFRTTVPVRRVLSQGRRAKVEVVDGGGGPVVRKTYAEGFTRYLDREIDARRTLAALVDAVPPLLETGPTWFSCPYYDDTSKGLEPGAGRPLVPLAVTREMVRVLRAIHDEGYDLVDAKPDNFVLDRHEGLKIVDFEFLHRYVDDPPPFVDSYNFLGPPAGFAGDMPVGDLSYEWRWRRYTGLPLRVLLDGSRASQVAWRAAYRAERLTVAPGSPPRRAARTVIHGLRAAKRLAVREYTVWARRRAESLDTRTRHEG